jgi:hypothetical protein
MNQTESYKILGNGLLEGGVVAYSANLNTGMVVVTGQVKVGVGFFAKNEPFTANYILPMADLLSTAADTVGKKVDIGPADLIVSHIDGTIATVDVVLDGLGTGHGVLDISSQYLKLVSLTANIKYSGIAVTASLQRI